MLLKEFCTSDVVQYPPQTSVLAAARLMRQRHVGDLIVIESADDPGTALDSARGISRRADCKRPMRRSWHLGRHGRMRLLRAGLRPATGRPGHLADDVLSIRLDRDAAAGIVVLVEFPDCPASSVHVPQRNGNTPVHFEAEQRFTDETLGRLRRIMRRRARTGRQEDRRGQPGQPERARWHPVWPR